MIPLGSLFVARSRMFARKQSSRQLSVAAVRNWGRSLRSSPSDLVDPVFCLCGLNIDQPGWLVLTGFSVLCLEEIRKTITCSKVEVVHTSYGTKHGL